MKNVNCKVLVLLLLLYQTNVFAQQTRTEKDLLGEKQIPADAYYGVQTARALENFQISGVTTKFLSGLCKSLCNGKAGSGPCEYRNRQNEERKHWHAIEKACQAIMDGKYHDQFLVDLYQGGAGTSANMNANEVIANIALEMSGHKKGEYHYC